MRLNLNAALTGTLFWQARCCVLIALVSYPVFSQQPPSQIPSPTTVNTRRHPRIPKQEVPGRRVELKALQGAVLFAGPRVNAEKAIPLIVHFHGAAWLIEAHIARHLPRAALVTVNLGAGSSSYGRPFVEPDLFQNLIDEARLELGAKRPWSSITLTGFSAGYGAVRAILRQANNLAVVNDVLLLDGMHASYSPAGEMRDAVNAADLDSFVKFAREAVAGRNGFIITHSEIDPGSYASTTECADHLLSELGLRRKRERRTGPRGMRQLTEVKAGRLRVFGYSGDTAPDHVDHFHAMPAWLKLLRIK